LRHHGVPLSLAARHTTIALARPAAAYGLDKHTLRRAPKPRRRRESITGRCSRHHSPKLRNVSLRLRRNLMHENATSPAPLTTRAALHEGARLTGATADARCSIIFAPTYFGSLRGVSRAVETRSRARRSS